MTLPSNIKTVAEAITFLTADNASKAAQIVALQGRATALEEKEPVPIEAPVITQRAAIGSDGSPQVGEELTGVDPVGNYPVSARRWLRGSTFLTDLNRYTPQVEGDYDYEGTIAAPDGRTAVSRSTITVRAASIDEPVVLQPNPPSFQPVSSTSTGLIDVDSGRITHRASVVVKEGGGDTKLQVAVTADDRQAVYISSGLIFGSNRFTITRRLLGNDYTYDTGTNALLPRALRASDVVTLRCDGDPRTIAVLLNDDVIFGPYLLSGAGLTAVWGEPWPETATRAGARSNAAAAEVTVGRIVTPVVVGQITALISGEVQATILYVGEPDAFRARIVRSNGTVVDDWRPTTVTATTGAGNATISFAPVIASSDAGADVVLEVQQMKSGAPIASTGKRVYFARGDFTPLVLGYNLARSVGSAERVVNDWSKEIYIDGNFNPPAFRVSRRGLTGSGYIQTNPGVTLTNQANDPNMTISSNPNTGRHDFVFRGDAAGERPIGLGGGPVPTSVKVYPGGQDPQTINDGILPSLSQADHGAGIRDLDWGAGNAQPGGAVVTTPASRSKLTSPNYVTGAFTGAGFSAGDALPYEVMTSAMNRIHANAPASRHWGHVDTIIGTDQYYIDQYTYIRDNLHPDVLIYTEFGNERPWNYNTSRTMLEAARSGLYGNGASVAYPDIIPVDFGGYGNNGIGRGPAIAAGKTIMFAGSGQGGNGAIFPGGEFIWRAKRDLAAGTDICEGENWEAIAGFTDLQQGARRWLGKRSVEVWTIIKDVFGATAFAARVRPTVCGQARERTFDHLALELNMPGFLNLCTNIGNSAYTYDNLDNRALTTVDQMYDGYINDLEKDHPARIAAWTDLVLKSGKQNYWYELALHTNIFVGAPHPTYKNSWTQLMADAPRIRELERRLARNMRQRATGPAFYYKGFIDPNWALRPMGYQDTTSPRWLGHKEGLAG